MLKNYNSILKMLKCEIVNTDNEFRVSFWGTKINIGKLSKDKLWRKILDNLRCNNKDNAKKYLDKYCVFIKS